MADPSSISRPLNRAQVLRAHELIKPYIHLTPVIHCDSISTIASRPQEPQALIGTPYEGQTPAKPRIRLFFKCENFQKVGAFKARGAFHALSRLSAGELEKGVITHSSGNHAQALALAARTRGIKAYVVMPKISTPSKIEATAGYGATVEFSGSTAEEREAVTARLQAETGAILVPPYDHPDVILGQGTLAIELEEQVKEICAAEQKGEREWEGFGWRSRADRAQRQQRSQEHAQKEQTQTPASTSSSLTNSSYSPRAPAVSISEGLDAVIAPCGGGGMLSGVATALAGTGISVFGAEPSYQGGDDCRRGLAMDPPTRIEKVSTLTIADGVRTPVGKIPWTVISDKTKVQGMYAVTEEQIKAALRLLMERAKVFVEPSAAVGLAAVLYNEEFRRLAEREAGPDGVWNIGVVLTGGNMTMEGLVKLFSEDAKTTVSANGQQRGDREIGKVGLDGETKISNVAG